MIDNKNNVWDREIHRNSRLREKVAYVFGILGLVFGGSAYTAKLIGKPTVIERPYVLLVDRETGASENLMVVKPAPIAQRGALIQSSIVKYITERESYYVAGIDERINSVLTRSEGQANSSLVALWSSDVARENYPPKRYGLKTYVSVKVSFVKIPREGEATVRFSKTISGTNVETRTQFFEAVLEYKLKPGLEDTLARVWNNPIGFKVTSYNLSAENIGAF